MASVIQLQCKCNHYPWGKSGKESLAARYAASAAGGNFKTDEKEQYAEMFPIQKIQQRSCQVDKTYGNI